MRRISAFLTSVVAGSAAVIGISASPATASAPVLQAASAVAPAAEAAPAAGTYRVVSHVRVLDSRAGTGGPKAAVAAGASRAFHVTGVRGLPASGVSAVTVNVTVLAPARTGSVSVFPGGTAWTGTASISFGATRTTQRVLTAKLGANGTLAIRNNLAVGVQVVADVTGYFIAGTPTVDGFYASVPLTRVLDTRSGIGGSKSAVAPGAVRTIQVEGTGAVPKTWVTAVAVNLTVLTPGQAGSIAVFPGGSRWNGSATVSFLARVTEQSMITAQLSDAGTLSVRNNTRLPLQLVADVAGYYREGTSTWQRGAFTPIASERLLDTRPERACATCGVGSKPRQQVIHALAPGPGTTELPGSGVAAIAVNISVLNATESGSLGVYPGTGGWNGLAPVTFHPGTSQSGFTAALGIDGTLTIRNNSVQPVDLVVDVVGYYVGQPSPQLDKLDQQVTAGHGTVQSLSCATAAFCLAVADSGGYALRYDGTSWSEPAAVPGMRNLFSVSCAGPTFCVAIGQDQPSAATAAVVYDGSAWSAPVRLAGAGYPPPVISCPSPSFCGAVFGAGTFLRYADGAWTTGPPVPGSTTTVVRTISCVSSVFCVATDRSGEAWSYDGTAWSDGSSVGSGGLKGMLSCVTTSFCMVADFAGRVSTYDGAHWSEPVAVPGARELDALSCPSVTFCVAAGRSDAFVFDGHSWQPTPVITAAAVRLLSCVSTTFCGMVDGGYPQGFSRYDGSTWGSVSLLDDARGGLTAVSCASPAFCAAVGYLGAAGHWNGSGWVDDGFIDPVHTLTAVSCPTIAFCVAVDTAGRALTFDGDSWSAPVGIDSNRALSAVSCGGVSSCVAVDPQGYATVYDGARWSAPSRLATSLSSVSCPQPTFCAATDSADSVFFFNGSGWTTARSGSGTYAKVSCASADFCLMVDDRGAMRYDRGRWSAVPANSAQTFDQFSCPAAGYCVGLNRGGVIAYDGVSWSLSGPPDVPTGISCPTTTFCMVVDQDGEALHN